jgi:hypothetical protein
MVETNETSEPFQERLPMKSSTVLNLTVAPSKDAWCVKAKLTRMVGTLFCLCFLSGICAPPLLAQSDSAADGATVKDGKVYTIQGGQLVELTEAVKLPFDVEVNTNGIFKVGDGKERTLGEGQIIRRDGWLVSPDGSVQPVFDHVAMQAGHVVVVRDGQAAPLATAMTFPSKMVVQPDGSCSQSQSGYSRLQDGQLFRMDGTGIMAKDAATLMNGRVVVQRGGSMIGLQSVQIMDMDNATRIYGDGRIEPRGGPTTKMRKGQTVLFDGMPARN